MAQIHSPSEMETVVLYPAPGMGHLISMVELGKLVLNHHPSLSVIILTTIPPFNTGATASYLSHISATVPSITFHHLPTTPLPLELDLYPSFEAVTSELLRINNPNVHQSLKSLSLTSTILAFIIDFFSTPAFPVAIELGIPVYYFYTSGAASFALFLSIPTLDRKYSESYKDMKENLHVPGLPPLPARDMPDPLLDRNSTDYSDFKNFAIHFAKSDGIIINIFESLEPRALEAILSGLCIPDGPTPPVYCIGPLIAADQQLKNGGVEHESLKWLDSQPCKSVIFLCFGSLGLFSAEQLKEIAIGLERSEQRFLWVVRSPPNSERSGRFLPPPIPDLDILLPNGFLERTKDRGLVVKSWAPQLAVLHHDSVGGFVTHCGWNSVLEAVCAGVPMVAWPLYAEQKWNRAVLVEELKLALPINISENGFVTSEEVAERVKQLMNSEESTLVRQEARKKKEEAVSAMSEGGSSRLALAKLVQKWKQK